ncbi:MAG TPA: thioesterase family protein [Burkholderiales bacterium]|nr:thioesterase family protein [Burkholderiales bacterium]
MTETYRGAVYPWHCDHMGHMNVMWYVGKFDEATWNLFALAGVTAAFLKENRRGMAAVQQNITYKRELHAGDTVVVLSAFLEVGEKTARFVHEMRHAVTGEVSAICVLTGVSIDTQTRKSCPLPAEIVERGRKLVRAYDLQT